MYIYMYILKSRGLVQIERFLVANCEKTYSSFYFFRAFGLQQKAIKIYLVGKSE